MTLHGVEALCFDVFGTVVDWRSGVAREAEAALAPRGIGLDWPAFADAWRARYQPAMEEVRAGRRPFVKLDVLHRENLEATLADFGVTGLPEAVLAALNLAWHRLDPWPDAAAGLARLRQRHILAPLSNGTYGSWSTSPGAAACRGTRSWVRRWRGRTSPRPRRTCARPSCSACRLRPA